MPDFTGVFTHFIRDFPYSFNQLAFLDGHYLEIPFNGINEKLSFQWRFTLFSASIWSWR
jgi:hypothetical protein